ncbi:similar to Saccharomyces cerevisiae YLR239C LIP2 Lipoyl ligase, involved in the modification of mitochondrial enzymes by the attachment of lipoic acid groups [Maudiozyma saulgeensis]|uniref:Octanoyltransferase n=1 Tax=Maudiozyma saulgeensis TaxID=1789683 RepID=A0A1X7RAX8_9SACH|nr:similar to Saccharomyces cerevisiae YLR239C LIP2 Lipoyl ligase, involved in the modification of mitochondrial enzymes by the attachment of lipoic acid groups [Kazachstania saulgeensis]
MLRTTSFVTGGFTCVNRRILSRVWYSNGANDDNCDRLKHKSITKPVDPSARVLRHIQFTKRMPFQQGLAIQEQFVRANLDMKKVQSKIEQKLVELEHEYQGNATINSNEKQILDKILAMKPNPMVLTFEYEPTYTGGKRIKKVITQEQISQLENFKPTKDIMNPSPKFVQVERGGELTFHGPGQIVAYIVLDLKAFKNFPARCLISVIETAAKNTLKIAPVRKGGLPLNIDTKRVGDKIGVWVMNDDKIASIGVHVRRSITSHGICINVCPDLSYLNNFEMCGNPDGKATSILNEFPNANVTIQDISIAFVRELAKLLGIDTVERMQTDGSEMNQL